MKNINIIVKSDKNESQWSPILYYVSKFCYFLTNYDKV